MTSIQWHRFVVLVRALRRFLLTRAVTAAPPELPQMKPMLRQLFGQRVRIPMVTLSGTIKEAGLSIKSVYPPLAKAFETESPIVCLWINSPGGSPAQSSQIYRTISTLKKHKKKRVVAFVQDVAASGGYYIACSADEIVLDENSIVGSIGVVSQWFGVSELLGKVGVKAMIETSGNKKKFLSPFEAEVSPDEMARLKALQTQIHDNFIATVKAARGTRLKQSDEAQLFSGDFWVGAKAVELGLADAINDPFTWIHENHPGQKFEMVARRPGFAARLLSMPNVSVPQLSVHDMLGAVQESRLTPFRT